MAILREFFLLLEYRDRVEATAETYQKKLISRFQDAKEKNELRGGPTGAVNKALDKEQNLDAAKTMVEYFAKNDPTKNNKYVDWMIRQWLKEKLLWEDAFKMTDLLTDFEKYRKKLDKKDLNQYDSYRDIEEALESHRGTDVAGVRVQNFLKKDDVQNYRKSQVADPSAPKHQESYNIIHAPEYDDDTMPHWFEVDLQTSGEAHADDALSLEDYVDDAYNELDRSDYEGEDEDDFDEESYESDAREQAAIKYEEAKEEFIASYVDNHGEEEWQEHLHQEQSNAEGSLEGSHHKVPELDVIYETDRMAVMIPNSKEASCFIGKGTKWCTSADVSDNAWWEYAQGDPLYAVITDKLGKFQFHFQTDQYMDVNDRYIEDSDALINLKSQYSKELLGAFDDLATQWEQWWMLPVERTPYKHWEKSLRQSDHDINQSVTRDAVRQYQAHAKDAPEGWAEQVRKNLLSGEYAGAAIKFGWVGKLTTEEIENVIATPRLFSSSTAAIDLAEHLDNEEIEISRDAWKTLIMRDAATLFHAPVEALDREMLDTVLQREADNHATKNMLTTSEMRKRSFLSDFYETFKHHKAEEEGNTSQADMDNIDDWVAHVKPTEKDNKKGLERGRRVAGMISMNDIIADVLRKPEVMQHFKTDFGMKPWMALADRAAGDEKFANRFVDIATGVIGNNKHDPLAKDIANLVHQLTAKYPDLATHVSNYPSKDMPLDTQNAVLDHVANQTGAGNQGDAGFETDAVARASTAHRVQQTIDPAQMTSIAKGIEPPEIDPNAREALFRYRQGGEDADEIRNRVPAQHQLDV